MYGLGTLSKRFSCSKSAPSTSITLVKDQIEEGKAKSETGDPKAAEEEEDNEGNND